MSHQNTEGSHSLSPNPGLIVRVFLVCAGSRQVSGAKWTLQEYLDLGTGFFNFKEPKHGILGLGHLLGPG